MLLGLFAAVVLTMLLPPSSAEAQQVPASLKLGNLGTPGTANPAPALIDALDKLGYHEGRNSAHLFKCRVEDFHVDERKPGAPGFASFKGTGPPKGRNDEPTELLVRPRIVGDFNSKQLMVGPLLQPGRVEIERLLERIGGEQRWECRVQASPSMSLLVPG
jgi:hypothetical protein